MATATSELPLPDEEHLPRGQACLACGAPLEPLDHFCNACGTPKAAPPAPVEAAPQRHFRCENCGAEVATDPGQRSYVCAFCESTYVVELPEGESGRQRPEFVIGFAMTPEQAQDMFKKWLRERRWFVPGDLKDAQIEDRLRGVYLPFWSFSLLARSRWSASIGEYWYRTETYTTTHNGKTVTRTRRVRETEWWPLAGAHHRYYSGYLVSGSQGLPQQYAEQIKPFHVAAMKRYEPAFLAGWLNEEYSVERDAALAQCQGEFQRQEQSNVAAFMPGDTHRSLSVETEFSDINSDLVLLPVYLLSYKYRDRVFRFLINGQTGRLYGDKPLSKKRIAAAIAAGVALVVLLFLLWKAFGP